MVKRSKNRPRRLTIITPLAPFDSPSQPPAPHTITVTMPAPPTHLRKSSSSVASIFGTKRGIQETDTAEEATGSETK
ncbi:hypothetical protein LguiA_010026 [Lonicera macranthoides]